MAKYDDMGHGDADGNYNDKQGRDRETRDYGDRMLQDRSQQASQQMGGAAPVDSRAPVEERVPGGGKQAGFADISRITHNEMNPLMRAALDALIPGGSWMASGLNALGVKYGGGMGGGGFSGNPDRETGNSKRWTGNASPDSLANALMGKSNSATPNQPQSQPQNSQLYYTYPDGSRVPMNGDPFSPTSAYDTGNNGYGNGNIDWFRALMGNAGNGQINW